MTDLARRIALVLLDLLERLLAWLASGYERDEIAELARAMTWPMPQHMKDLVNP